MRHTSPDIQAYYQQALVYDQNGDTYNAVKLYKKIIKIAPDWNLPYIQLSSIYKTRQEWKAVLHYNKKTVALSPSNKQAWWDIGLAATALKKWRIAKRIWSKFGYSSGQVFIARPICIQLQYGNQFEIVWANTIDPVRAELSSIPLPTSGCKFGDILLLDDKVIGHNVVGNKKFPVYDDLGIFKLSRYKTYTFQLHYNDKESLFLLEKLCSRAQLGFENWSNCRQVLTNKAFIQPEYQGQHPNSFQTHKNSAQIAVAALKEKEVIDILDTWTIISLGQFSDLKELRIDGR